MAISEEKLKEMLRNGAAGVRIISNDKPAPATPKTTKQPVQNNLEVFCGGLLTIFIEGDVRSSKNSQRIGRRQDGSPLVMHSKAASAYVTASKPQWMDNADSFKRAAEGLPRPLIVAFQWVRKTKGSFDHTGPLEMVLDCMTGKKFKDPSMSWIKDDTAGDICPIPISKVIHNKDRAGVYITLLEKHPLL